jgi:hypothetical protein
VIHCRAAISCRVGGSIIAGYACELKSILLPPSFASVAAQSAYNHIFGTVSETMSARRKSAKPTIFTVGHSTRPLEDFIKLLKAHGVQRVIDIRSIPRSRHNPQFNREALGPSLRKARIAYVHLKKLGGLRHAKAESKNLGWHNASFRGFADYMQTPEFAEGLERALKLASTKPSALMCAEAVPWRCHRSLVADALLVRGVPVEDIMTASRTEPHTLTPFARVRGKQITYPTDEPVNH